MNKCAVYGTLKHDRPDTHYIMGTIYDVGMFPAIILGGNKKVSVQVLGVTDDDLRNLDRYEGVPSLYTRERTTAFSFEDGSAEDVWVYQWARSTNDLELIESGRWNNGGC